MSEASLANYRRFVDHATMHGGLKAPALRLGADDQFPLRHAPNNIRFRHYGPLCQWLRLGRRDQVMNCYEGTVPRENAASCGILVRYGAFDYFTAGDIGDNSRLEYPCAKAVGRPVEAMKSNHHMSRHTMSERMLSVLDPDVIVTQSFYVRAIQPDTAAIRRISEHRGKGADGCISRTSTVVDGGRSGTLCTQCRESVGMWSSGWLQAAGNTGSICSTIPIWSTALNRSTGHSSANLGNTENSRKMKRIVIELVARAAA